MTPPLKVASDCTLSKEVWKRKERRWGYLRALKSLFRQTHTHQFLWDRCSKQFMWSLSERTRGIQLKCSVFESSWQSKVMRTWMWIPGCWRLISEGREMQNMCILRMRTYWFFYQRQRIKSGFFFSHHGDFLCYFFSEKVTQKFLFLGQTARLCMNCFEVWILVKFRKKKNSRFPWITFEGGRGRAKKWTLFSLQTMQNLMLVCVEESDLQIRLIHSMTTIFVWILHQYEIISMF